MSRPGQRQRQRQRRLPLVSTNFRIFDVIDGRRGGPRKDGSPRTDTIMIIINFTGIIGYRLYLFSTTGRSVLLFSSLPTPPSPLPPPPAAALSSLRVARPYLPPRRRIEAKLRIGWEDAHGERDSCIYKLTKQRYAILKCPG